MFNDPLAIRNYQKLTDSLVDMSNKGYSRDELRLFIDGFLAALQVNRALEIHIIHRLETEAVRFLYDPSSFGDPFQTETESQQEVSSNY